MGQTRYDDNENDDGEWTDDDEDDGYVPCRYCGETMLEAADHCPACDRWISKECLPEKRRPWWVIVVILALLIAFISTIV